MADDTVVAQGLFVKLGRGIWPSWRERTWAIFSNGQLRYYEVTNLPLHLLDKDYSTLLKGEIDLTLCTIKDSTVKASKVVASPTGSEVALQLTSREGRNFDCIFATPDAAQQLLSGLAQCGHPGVTAYCETKGWSLAGAKADSVATTPEDAPSPPLPSDAPAQDDEVLYETARMEQNGAAVAVDPISLQAPNTSSLLASVSWASPILFVLVAVFGMLLSRWDSSAKAKGV